MIKKCLCWLGVMTIIFSGNVYAAEHGFATHFAFGTNSDEEIELLKQAGVKQIRDELYWEFGEKEKGKYDFGAFPYMQKLNNADMDIILTLVYSNNLYCPHTKYAPDNEKSIKAYADYCAAAAREYPWVDKFEIWNEPNLEGFWGRTPSVDEYAELFNAAAKAIHEVRPDASVIGGVFSDYAGMPFMKRFLENEVYENMDGISFHPYSYHDSGTQSYFESRLEYNIDLIENMGGFKDVYVTEIGWPTVVTEKGFTEDEWNRYTDISEERQAYEIIRAYVLSDYHGLESLMIYDFKNDGTNASEKEHNFGVIKKNRDKKKAYYAVAEFNNRTNDALYCGKKELGGGKNAHIYYKNGEGFAVVWAENKSQSGNIHIKNVREVYDLYGMKTGENSDIKAEVEPKYVYAYSQTEAAAVCAESALSELNGVDGISEEFYNVMNFSAERILTEDEIEFCINKISEAGLEKINAYHSGESGLSDSELSSELNKMFKALECISKIGEVGGGGKKKISLEQMINSIKKEISNSKSKMSKYAFSMLRQAKKYAVYADKKNVYAYSDAAECLCRWAQKMTLASEFGTEEVLLDIAIRDDNVISVRGNSPNDAVTVCILKPDGKGLETDFLEKEILLEDLDFIFQEETKADGIFEFSYETCSESGQYILYLYSSKNNCKLKADIMISQKKTDILDAEVVDNVLSVGVYLSADDGEKIIAAAEYKDKRLIAVEILDSYSGKNSIKYNIKCSEYDAVKLFIWNRNNLKPILDNLEFIKNQSNNI